MSVTAFSKTSILWAFLKRRNALSAFWGTLKGMESANAEKHLHQIKKENCLKVVDTFREDLNPSNTF